MTLKGSKNRILKLEKPILKKGEALVVSACKGQCRGKNSVLINYEDSELNCKNVEKKVG